MSLKQQAEIADLQRRVAALEAAAGEMMGRIGAVERPPEGEPEKPVDNARSASTKAKAPR